jgi:hypothetical protein
MGSVVLVVFSKILGSRRSMVDRAAASVWNPDLQITQARPGRSQLNRPDQTELHAICGLLHEGGVASFLESDIRNRTSFACAFVAEDMDFLCSPVVLVQMREIVFADRRVQFRQFQGASSPNLAETTYVSSSNSNIHLFQTVGIEDISIQFHSSCYRSHLWMCPVWSLIFQLLERCPRLPLL